MFHFEELVDQDALTEALQLGKIAGAGLDVAIPDPLPVEHPLYEMDNVGKNIEEYILKFYRKIISVSLFLSYIMTPKFF